MYLFTYLLADYELNVWEDKKNERWAWQVNRLFDDTYTVIQTGFVYSSAKKAFESAQQAAILHLRYSSPFEKSGG